ncbi:hypothetical protein NXC14_CH01970 [Rhizobium sp. NXC14]|uniref:hypothetical protein n=1 Tax=Rhizobium sp. NXC14 TaxID=1981173 RepID=UPI000A20350C|nr:hypothetical protein [Rhizobium sp. NXC14]ARO29920.1 hypothetical protein NXC14_CH01970 [Rhizobium sp. NXC14]
MFHKSVTVVPSSLNCLTRSGAVTLATVNTKTHLNLIVSKPDLTLSPAEAQQLRDLLIEAYPLEAPATTKFKAGDKVTYKAIVGYGARGMDGRKGVVESAQAGGWFMVKFVGGPFDSLIKVHENFLELQPATSTQHVGGFRIGDRVRRLQGSRKGEVFTVTEFNSSLTELKVDGMTGWRMPKYFEPVTEAVQAPAVPVTGRFIVAALEGTTYAPGSKPKVHLTNTAAEAEAQRLAKEIGGTYHVLKATFEASREKPVIPPVKTAKL